jgi:hypothetical protein
MDFVFGSLPIILGLLGIFFAMLSTLSVRGVFAGWRERRQERARAKNAQCAPSAPASTEGDTGTNIPFYRGDLQRASDWSPKGPYLKRETSPGKGLVYSFLLVVCVFGIAIAVVWTLTHIGGPLQATVNATVAQAGGSILIVGGGLFAAFFAVAFMAFVAIRFFAGRFDR